MKGEIEEFFHIVLDKEDMSEFKKIFNENLIERNYRGIHNKFWKLIKQMEA